MVGQLGAPSVGEDRLDRASAMVNDAVALLLDAIREIKGEKGNGDDDRNAAREPDGNDQQPG
jgi:hypothetical protein